MLCFCPIDVEVHGLHTLGSGQGSDVSRLGTDVIDDGGLKPGNNEMGSFVVNLLLNTKDAGVFDSTVTSVDW